MEALFGRLAVHTGFITMEQLAEATRLQSRPDEERRLGQILVDLGYLTLDQLNQILMHQKAFVEAQILGVDQAPPPKRAKPTAGKGIAIGAISIGTRKRVKATVAAVPAAVVRPPSNPLDTLFDDLDEPLPFVPEAEDEHPSITVTRSPQPEGRPAQEDLLRTCLREAFTLGASDVHAHAGTPLRIRLHGRLSTYGDYVFDPIALEQELRTMMPPSAQARFDETGQADFVHHVPEAGRCRINVYRQLHGVDAVLRLLAATPPTLSDLGLPNAVARTTNFDHGLVLVTGPAGSGRTSTLAGLVDLINEERRVHIVTIEDPIEYVHTNKRSVVNQRQVGEHTNSFPRALSAATREGADVIVISGLPDPETIEMALTAAETGHLVISTMTTSSIEDTIQRLQNSFPPNKQARARTLIADTLRAVVTQRLVPAAHQDRVVAAIGMLLLTPAVGNLIRDDKTNQLPNFIQTNRAAGNCLLDDYLAHLVKTGQITRDSARSHAADPARFDPTRPLAAAQGG